tara:strand:- start:10453 stop:11367 length:915 start_codon:yes stop_codon:yes gene_type:complete
MNIRILLPLLFPFLLLLNSACAQEKEKPSLSMDLINLYTGNYADPRGGVIQIDWKEDYLFVFGDSLPELKFWPESDSSFKSKEYDIRIEFTVNQKTNDVRLQAFEEGQLSLNVLKDYFRDLTGGAEAENWTLNNRGVTFDGTVYQFDSRPGIGLLWLKDEQFVDGTIEFEAKGKSTNGQSFLGIAFHGKDLKTYNAIYFRPFTFDNPERLKNSIQYISLPDYPWFILRENFPEKYEDEVYPVPDPEEWFHVRIEVNTPEILVYINHSDIPSMSIEKLRKIDGEKIGFWVDVSDGSFRNLIITKK